MDTFTKGKPAAEAGEEPAAPARKRMRASEYFANQKNARTLTPGTVAAEIVSCALKGETQFMKEAECVGRGGTPKR
jgi:hypothetical protein